MKETVEDLARRYLPTKLRKGLGAFLLRRRASMPSPLLKIYFRLVHGYNLDKLKVKLTGKDAIYTYKSHKIRCPREGLGIFFKVFRNKAYDKMDMRKGDVVVDVGAYVGMLTVKASVDVGDKGLVVAVEPRPTNAKYIKENCRDLPNVTIVQEALWKHTGKKDFYISYASAGDSLVYEQKDKIEVWTETLDNLAKGLDREINCIKIDAQGSELDILEGAEETLKGPVRLAIASHYICPDGSPEAPKLIQFLEERGFKVTTESKERRYVYARKN